MENHSAQIRWSFNLRYNVTGQRTEREVFPGFVVRNRTRPQDVMTDPTAWANAWFRTRDQVAVQGKIAFNERWARFGEHRLCA